MVACNNSNSISEITPPNIATSASDTTIAAMCLFCKPESIKPLSFGFFIARPGVKSPSFVEVKSSVIS